MFFVFKIVLIFLHMLTYGALANPCLCYIEGALTISQSNSIFFLDFLVLEQFHSNCFRLSTVYLKNQCQS